MRKKKLSGKAKKVKSDVVRLRITSDERRKLERLRRKLKLSYSQIIRLSLFGRPIVGELVQWPGWVKGKSATWKTGKVTEGG